MVSAYSTILAYKQFYHLYGFGRHKGQPLFGGRVTSLHNNNYKVIPYCTPLYNTYRKWENVSRTFLWGLPLFLSPALSGDQPSFQAERLYWTQSVAAPSARLLTSSRTHSLSHFLYILYTKFEEKSNLSGSKTRSSPRNFPHCSLIRAPTTYQAPLSLLDPAPSMRSPTDLRRLRRHLSRFSLISSAKPAVIVPAWKDFQII